MNVEFNYRYYTNEDDFEHYHLNLIDFENKSIAYQLEEVGDVIDFAQQQQQQGKYVALYLTYEAAKFFNPNMTVYQLDDDDVVAAAYSFNQAVSVEEDKIEYNLAPTTQDFNFSESNVDMVNHIKAVQQAIIEGDTYQVNYTTRLIGHIYEPITSLYRRLTQFANGNYTVLLNTEELNVASISPELFFQYGQFKHRENMIMSKPMKGTMPRGKTIEEDKANYQLLKESSKDQAENVMIVDLLRNDISRIAENGTIKVDKLFFIETYQTVYQMTTMVSGKVKPQYHLVDVFTALFPCGSITGAPKLSTMRYINQLESTPRSIYCGTIGLLLPTEDDRMIFNIPIRTVEYRHDQAIYGVGAGITIDSDPQGEVQEFHDKTKILEKLQ